MKTLKIKTRFAMDTATLNDAELGRLFRGMLQYASSGAEPTLSGTERVLWPATKADIDEQLETFKKRSAANTSNVTKRYEPLRNATKSTNRINSYQFVEQEKEEREESGEREEQKEKRPPHTPPVKERQEEKEGKEGKAEKEHTARARGFTPPTLDEVRAYCRERSSPVDPEQFYDYFQAGHWIDAKGQPVRNWKQKLLTWEKFNCGTSKRPASGVKTTNNIFLELLEDSNGQSRDS